MAIPECVPIKEVEMRKHVLLLTTTILACGAISASAQAPSTQLTPGGPMMQQQDQDDYHRYHGGMMGGGLMGHGMMGRWRLSLLPAKPATRFVFSVLGLHAAAAGRRFHQGAGATQTGNAADHHRGGRRRFAGRLARLWFGRALRRSAGDRGGAQDPPVLRSGALRC